MSIEVALFSLIKMSWLALYHGYERSDHRLLPLTYARPDAGRKPCVGVRVVGAADRQGRPGVSWSSVVLRLPDDGIGALRLLRHLILADAKSATYKLGLL